MAIPTEDIEDADKDSPDAGLRNGKENKVAVTTEEIPFERELPPQEDRITQEQIERLEIRFRENLKPELQKDAKKYMHDFLGINLWLDEHGNPSAKSITKAMYPQVGKSALAFARSL